MILNGTKIDKLTVKDLGEESYNRHFGNQIILDDKEPTPPNITDKITDNVFGITVMDQRSIDEIFNNSGPLAVNNEFQVHYSALTGNFKSDGQTLYINIPLIYYNYKQAVSMSHISFNYGEVKEASDQVEPIAVALASKLLETEYIENIRKVFTGIEFSLTSLHTMHRHPGQMDVFSGTDYKKNYNNPGIVYPIMSCEEVTSSFSSIICSYANTMKVVRTECREVIVDDNEDINYFQGRSQTLVKGYSKKQTDIEKLFNVNPRSIDSYMLKDGDISLDSAIVDMLLNDTGDFKANTDFIDSSNLSTKQSSYYNEYQYRTPYKDNLYLPEASSFKQGKLFEDKKSSEEENSCQDKIINQAEPFSEQYEEDSTSGYFLFDSNDPKSNLEDYAKVLRMELWISCNEPAIDLLDMNNSEIFEMAKEYGLIVQIPS